MYSDPMEACDVHVRNAGSPSRRETSRSWPEPWPMAGSIRCRESGSWKRLRRRKRWPKWTSGVCATLEGHGGTTSRCGRRWRATAARNRPDRRLAKGEHLRELIRTSIFAAARSDRFELSATADLAASLNRYIPSLLGGPRSATLRLVIDGKPAKHADAKSKLVPRSRTICFAFPNQRGARRAGPKLGVRVER